MRVIAEDCHGAPGSLVGLTGSVLVAAPPALLCSLLLWSSAELARVLGNQAQSIAPL